MERLDAAGPPRGGDGIMPGLGEVVGFILLPDPGGGVEGGDVCQVGPHYSVGVL